MRVVIFGVGQLSSLAWYCLSHDSPHEVSAFTVDGTYLDRSTHCGLPVVAFETLQTRFPPADNLMMIPIGITRANSLRALKYEQAKRNGYQFATYVSSHAITWPDLEIGENSLVYEGTIIQPYSRIGNNVILRSGANVSHHATVGDHCFLANNATLGGDVTLEESSFIGLSATVRDGVTIARGCQIAAGALVTSDTTENGVYAGSPARRRKMPADRFIL